MSAVAERVIGREEELAAVREFLAAEAVAPAALLIEGEAGIGKTTLWRAGAEWARERGMRVLSGRPAEAEKKLSFATLGDLLASALDDLLPTLPPPQRRALEIALLLEEGEASAGDPRTLGVAVANGLRALSSSGRLVIAVDDVQWLDSSSASVLAFALRRLDTEPITLLLAQRLEDAAPTPLALERTLTPDRLRRLRVPPLSLGAVHRLLDERLGVLFRRPLLRRLHDLCGGNPFFALEVGRALGELEGRLDPGQPLPVPDELRRLIAQRLGRLSAATQEALAVAAALSQPTLELIAAATDDAAAARLEPALRAHVVEVDDGRVRFTHPLLASAAYASKPPAQMRAVHANLARLVPDLEERAHHLALSAEAPGEAVALALEQASRRASGRGAPGAAADLCAQARALTPPEDGEALRRRILQEAEYAMQSGDTPRARRVLEQALITSPAGRPRAELLTYLARVHFNGLDWRSSVGFLEQAAAEAGDDVPLRAQIELHLALNLDLLRTDVGATLAHARAAVRLAERLDEAATLAEALALQAKSEFLLGRRWPQALVERALALEPSMAALPADRWPRDYVAAMLAWTDDIDGALAGFAAVETAALEQGDEVALVWTLARTADLECRAGAWHEALRLIERGYEIALQAGQTANQALFLGTRALVEAHLGLTDSTRDTGERALELAEQAGAVMARRTALSALGLLALSLGEPREADAYLAPLTAETRAAGVGEPGAMRFLPDAIEALVSLGRLDEAEDLLAFLEERANATRRLSAIVASARCRALLEIARGEAAAGHDAIAKAVVHLDRVPMPFEQGRTLTVLGQVQRRVKEKAAARATLQQAIAVFEGLGAALWAARARSELARVGGRAARPGELTPTEVRVAELVAEGLSNKDVAATLFVTSKTVEGTLSRIYSKLGVHSRTELAHRLRKPDQASKV